MSLVAHRSGRPSEWMSIHEAASLVGVSPATLRRWCVAGDVPAFTTPGGHRRFSRRAINQLLSAEPAGVTDAQLDDVAAALERELRRASSRIAAMPPWAEALDAVDLDELDLLSRGMIDELVAGLSQHPRRGPRRRSFGGAAAMRSGEIIARRGIALDVMIDAGLRLQAAVVHEVAEASDRLGLDGPTAARWLDLAAGCASGFLTDGMRGHAAAGNAELESRIRGGGP